VVRVVRIGLPAEREVSEAGLDAVRLASAVLVEIAFSLERDATGGARVGAFVGMSANMFLKDGGFSTHELAVRTNIACVVGSSQFVFLLIVISMAIN